MSAGVGPDRRRVVLDTDIGSDVDDAMALALLLGLDAVDLLAVTTVYGDTLLRARLAARYAGLAGAAPPVHAGRTQPRSGREVWWAGHEGTLHLDLERERVADGDAVDRLTSLVAAHPGEVDLIAIGPLTNIAAALDADPGFASHVRGLWVMGGSFGDERAEHNFASDADAAARVFAAGLPTVVAGLETTQRLSVGSDQLSRIAAAGRLGATLARDIDQWWAFWKQTWSVPHDPVTVLSLARPDLFTLSPPGRVTIDLGPDRAGQSAFRPDPGGRTRIVTDLDVDAVVAAMVNGIVAAGLRSGSGTG